MVLQMTSHLCLLVLSGLAASSRVGLEDVFYSPQDQAVREGERVFFQCVSGESFPPARIAWFKDGEVVTRGQQIQGEFGGGNQKKTSGTLHLFNVTIEDTGIYVCVTHNPLLNVSMKSKPAKLTVQGVPRRLQIIQGPDNITVAVGTVASMHCTVRGFPVPMVHWFKNGCHRTNCSTLFSPRNNGQLLTFRNVTKEDEGSYYCEASNQRETIKSEPAFLLVAEMDWSFVQQPTNLTVKKGENATVTCRPPHSSPAAQVFWFKDNQLLATTAHVTVLPNGDLFFYSIQEFDSGSYFCRASNIHLRRFVTSRRASLTVLAPPSVKLWPQQLTVPVGARVKLECQVSGHPLPTVRWVKRGHSKQTGGKVALGLRNVTLQIQSARIYDEGVYICEALNSLGQSFVTAVLRVAVSPIIVTFLTQISCRIGTSVVLPCWAAGIPPITYTWSRGRAETHSPVTPTENRHVDENGTLHILNVQWSDGGEYYCTAKNRAGQHQRWAILTVTAEDDPPGRDVQTGPILSPRTITDTDVSSDSFDEQHLKTTARQHVQSQYRELPCSPSSCDTTRLRFTTISTLPRGAPAEQKLSLPSQRQRIQLTTSPNQLLLTQIPHPFLAPPLHPNSHSVDPHTQVLGTDAPLLMSSQETPTTTQKPHSEKWANATAKGLSGAHKLDYNSSFVSPKSRLLPNESNRMATNGQLHLYSLDLNLTLNSQSRVQTSNYPRPSTFLSQSPQTQPQQALTLKFYPEIFTNQTHLTSTETPSPPASSSHLLLHNHSQPLTTRTASDIFALPQTQTQPFSNTSTQDSETPAVPQLNQSDQVRLNSTGQVDPDQSMKTTNDTEVNTELLKKNTSQSPMTSNNPRVTHESWLPVVEKHDIPIVVGVGVSLAFIFITVTFYYVVQKNEPAPTNRAAQRNLGVPVRHAERRAAGRTYENRAFEDDDCVAVVEQSPYTSDTRARPPGPSLVTVQILPTHDDLTEDAQPTLDHHSITVETYPDPVPDSKHEPCVEEEMVCTMSQPNIQLQCADDWTSNSPCQDSLPPPSSLPSTSPSPSPPSRREEALHSSLTLQSPEQWAAPIQHSLSISHGSPPLLLSHHVSLGLTTVAVDVHFYPPATTALSVGTGAHASSASNSSSVTAPPFTSPFVNSQEADQSAARFHQSK